MHASGHLAEPPIALAEVQGYQYAALLAAADLAEALGAARRARRRCASAPGGCASDSRPDFWLPDEAFYALALDARRRRPAA